MRLTHQLLLQSLLFCLLLTVTILLSQLCCAESLELGFLGRLINFFPDYAISVALEQTLQDCSSCEKCLEIPRLPPCSPWDGASGHTYLLDVLLLCWVGLRQPVNSDCRMGKALSPIQVWITTSLQSRNCLLLKTNETQLKNSSQRWLWKGLSAKQGSNTWTGFSSRSTVT